MSDHTSVPPPEAFLRRVLLLDAASCAVLGGTSLLFASGLADPLGASSTLLRMAGAVLVLCAVVIGTVAGRRPLPRPAVAAIVVLNVAWAVASLALAAGAWTTLSSAGVAVDVVQAVAVLGLAATEATGLYRLHQLPRSGRPGRTGADSPSLAR